MDCTSETEHYPPFVPPTRRLILNGITTRGEPVRHRRKSTSRYGAAGSLPLVRPASDSTGIHTQAAVWKSEDPRPRPRMRQHLPRIHLARV